MDTYEIIAQAVGIVAMAMNIISYQLKKQKSIIAMQFFGAALFTVNMFMIGAIVGGFLNAVGAVRALVYVNKQKFKADRFIWVLGFGVLYFVAYGLTFFVFDKEPTAFNLIIEFLPIIGMFATGIGFYLKDAKSVRRAGLVSSPSWLIYNIFNFAIGGIICEILALISIITAMRRLDRKKEE
ncbi:MAG: YgjV family protein [Clostridia bacterium]|nr:YgjV family protein [Clostridia bacterium]